MKDNFIPTMGKTLQQRSSIAGFSLIEMMIALTLGLLVSFGLVTVFTNTSNTNRLQDALARLQENGRYAVSRMTNDLQMANGQFCSNSTGIAQVGTHKVMENPTAPLVYYHGSGNTISLPDLNTKTTDTVAPPANGEVVLLTGQSANSTTGYMLTPRYFMQGYSCPPTAGACNPLLPANQTTKPATPSDAPLVSFPTAGISSDKRLQRTDALTIRYMQAPGWSLNDTSMACTGGVLTSITIPSSPAPNPALNFDNTNELAMLASCSSSVIFKAAAKPVAGTAFVPAGIGATNNLGTIPCPSTQGNATDVRLFNFTRDFITVSYYLQVTGNVNNGGRNIPSLMRSVNGAAGDELVQGVERLSFLYGVEDNNGATYYLTANFVDAGTDSDGTVLSCPPHPDPTQPAGTEEPGCLWRAVKSIEAFMLLTTVDDINSLSVTDQGYRYSFDVNGRYKSPINTTSGNPEVYYPPAPTSTAVANSMPTTAPASIDPATSTMPTGLPAGRMLRREFRALIAVMNHNS